MGLPSDLFYGGVLFVILLIPALGGLFFATSRFVLPSRDRWYQEHLEQSALDALEMTLEQPISCDEHWDDDEEVTGTVVHHPKEREFPWSK